MGVYDPVTKELSVGAYFLIIIFYIIGIVFLAVAYWAYKNYDDASLVYLLIGLVAMTIGSIPYMYSAPAMPTITRNGNVITVTNYNSLGNPSLELWGITDGGTKYKIDGTDSQQYNSVGHYFTYIPSAMNYVKFAVRNYTAGLVFSQSAFL